MIYTSITLPGNNGDLKITDQLSTFTDLGSLITNLLPYIFIAAGLILFFIIIAAGFSMFASAGNPEKSKKAGQQLTFGIVGFFIIFASYWISQLLEKIFGINILGS
ncbi:MAG: hypothetical protein U9Q63_00455 [Patescibacteria group bacterium]|nr:hypothetical protein [Patescibacteria group bacterium]